MSPLTRLITFKKCLVAGLVLLVGLTAWGLWPWRPPAPPPSPPPAHSEAPPPSKMESLSLIEVENGGKRWVLDAKSAEYLKDRDEIRIKDINLEFFGEGGRKILLSCQEGLINTKAKTLRLEGQVILQDGALTIRTDTVRYDPKERILVAPAEVVLEGPRAKVLGKDLRVELSHRRLALAQHQRTEIRMGEREWPWR